jgi:hypothetical protein
MQIQALDRSNGVAGNAMQTTATCRYVIFFKDIVHCQQKVKCNVNLTKQFVLEVAKKCHKPKIEGSSYL